MRISDWSSDVCSSDLLALFGTARLRRQKSGDLAEHGELGGRCRGARTDGRAELAQEEHPPGLAVVVRMFPSPRAFVVGADVTQYTGGGRQCGRASLWGNECQ